MKKPNKLTEGANLIWEGSRMMLPEHVVEINRHRRESQRRPLPQLDDQELEEISREIGNAMQNESLITLIVWGEYEDRQLAGTVKKVENGQVRLLTSEGVERVPFEWIMRVEN